MARGDGIELACHAPHFEEVQHPSLEALAKLLPHALKTGRVDVEADHRQSVGNQPHADRTTHPAGSAGHNRDLGHSEPFKRMTPNNGTKFVLYSHRPSGNLTN